MCIRDSFLVVLGLGDTFIIALCILQNRFDPEQLRACYLLQHFSGYLCIPCLYFPKGSAEIIFTCSGKICD